MTGEELIGSAIKWLVGTDSTTRLVTLALFFLIVYFALIWFITESKILALSIAFLPILILDAVVSFGTFIFNLPLNISYTVDRYVLTLQGLSFVFNFTIFKNFGLETFNSVSGTVVLSGFQQFFVWILTFGDSILEFFILFYALYYILNDWQYALLGSSAATIAYAVISNPLKEFADSTKTISHALYFADHSTVEQQLIVVGALVLSFMFVWLLISVCINLFFSGAKMVRPGLEETGWAINLSGVAFGLTLFYAISQLLHPEYQWFVVLPILIIVGILKNILQRHASNKKDAMDRRRELEDVIRGVQ